MIRAQAHLATETGLDSGQGIGASSAAFEPGPEPRGLFWTRLLTSGLPSCSRPATPSRYTSPVATGAVSSLVQTGPPVNVLTLRAEGNRS